MVKVIGLANKTKKSIHWSVQQMLDAAKEDISPDIKKSIVIYLDEQDGQYITHFLQSGMKISECVALLESVKYNLLQSM